MLKELVNVLPANSAILAEVKKELYIEQSLSVLSREYEDWQLETYDMIKQVLTDAGKPLTVNAINERLPNNRKCSYGWLANLVRNVHGGIECRNFRGRNYYMIMPEDL